MARQTQEKIKLAKETWERYTGALTTGHADYQERAVRNERFYLGGGRQWDDELKKELEDEGRPWLEHNLIWSTINTVLGYQTQTRLDIAYKPRETDDQEMADLLSKISMHILDQNNYPWTESTIFADGMIQGRGFFDIRLTFDDNMYGNIEITAKDPMDIIPDQDAKSYDPDDWNDVMETRWMTIDEIREMYGNRIANEVERTAPDEPDFGVGEIGRERNSFGNAEQEATPSWTTDGTRVPHVRVIERQWKKVQMREYYVNNETGDLREVPEGLSNREKNQFARENDYSIIKKLIRRIRWTVSTRDIILHDDWSPYNNFTIVPFFPYFRRGVTMGVVDNLISTQEMFNKVFSQMLHAVNSSANSGWVVEENSLSNMDVEDLEDVGASTGLVLEYKAGRERPEKIKHNEVPTGLDRLIDKAGALINVISGVSDVFQGQQGNEVTGIAIQSRVQQNAIQLAAPIDNLYRSRHILAKRMLELVQDFYTEERMFTVTSVEQETGEEVTETVTINQYDDEIQEYLNDTTQGKYDVVVSDVPNQVTFQNAQFAQAVELRKFGVAIPDDEMVRLSSLSRKNELAKRMSGQGNPEVEQAQMEQMKLELESLKSELKKMSADTANRNIQTVKDATEVAKMLADNPELAVMAQQIVQGVGMELSDEDEMAGEAPGQELSPEQLQEMQMQMAGLGGGVQ